MRKCYVWCKGSKRRLPQLDTKGLVKSTTVKWMFGGNRKTDVKAMKHVKCGNRMRFVSYNNGDNDDDDIKFIGTNYSGEAAAQQVNKADELDVPVAYPPAQQKLELNLQFFVTWPRIMGDHHPFLENIYANFCHILQMLPCSEYVVQPNLRVLKYWMKSLLYKHPAATRGPKNLVDYICAINILIYL